MIDACRILHVEDSPDDAKLMRIALSKVPLAFSDSRVETEADYLAEMDARLPDVILCDYELPRFSAERALQIMQQRGLDIPFIIISHHIDQNAAVVAMQQGASDYLSKRDLGRLGKAIESAIDRAKARRETAKALEALRDSEAMKRGILDSLDSTIAVLDGRGVILAVNKAWEDFDTTRIGSGFPSARPGDNYLEFLAEAANRGYSFALDGIEAIRSVMAREKRFASLDYQFTLGSSTRWFLARAMPLEGSEHGAVVSHQDITDRMMSHVALDGALKRLQVLSKRVITIQEEERRSISCELHDDIGQSLAALKIGLLRLAQEKAGGESKLLDQCLEIADATLERLRRMALDLRPPQLDQLGLGEALTWLVERQRGATGLQIACSVSGLEERPPPALEGACYRIAQEAINNASRHAKATNITVSAESDGHLLKLTIRDDGEGFDEAAARGRALRSGSLGLISMEERAQYAGGRLKLRSVPGAGTTVSAIFPLDLAAP